MADDLTPAPADTLAINADDKQLNKTIARYGRVDLLCIDELGYMELDRHGAELLCPAVGRLIGDLDSHLKPVMLGH